MSNNKFKILIIEDEEHIRHFVETILDANGYQVLQADNGENGVLMFRSYYPDLVILDLGLPDMDGQDFIREIRKNHITPIIVLSARTNEEDKVMALDMGANDYVTKPFGTGELLARVRTTLRNNLFVLTPGMVPEGKYILGDLQIDYDGRRVFIGENEIRLTQTEYNIVVFLSKHPGKVITYNDIVKDIWGVTDAGSVKKLQVNMANIRKKFGEIPGDYKYISNELGVGYRMNEMSE